MAFAESFGTRVCEVVEVSKPTASSMTVHRVACVVDCGTVINPDSVEAQMQGGILHALNATLWGQSTFTAGKAGQTNFNKYRVMRIGEMPQVTVQIVASTDAPSRRRRARRAAARAGARQCLCAADGIARAHAAALPLRDDGRRLRQRPARAVWSIARPGVELE